jgi:signal transduction histidine kinase/CheY-like chemotaxis protein
LPARFHAGDYESAIYAELQAQRLLWTSPSFFEVAEFRFYAALARAAYCGAVPAEQHSLHREALDAHHRQLETWAQHCPENFGTCTALVGAEIARLEGRHLDAERLYEESIQLARKNGFVHNEGIASELAARFYAARAFETIAQAYLRNARYCYLRWGADGKVRQLDESHPQLAGEPSAPPPTTTIGASVEHLDLTTVVKVSQAVSGQIVLEKLIDTLMRTALEHAGAQRGLLIVPHGSEHRIEAEANTSGASITVRFRQASVSAADLPGSVLHYVVRTRESVILDDASAQNAFSTDEYILRNRVRSALCLPLIKQAALIGVLYLENNLAPRVFTPARNAVLRLIASQAAVSLENAHLYTDLKEENTRRKHAEEAQRAQEQEREEMQRQLQQAAKMEALGRMAGGIAHDFNNILGAIIGYGELAQSNQPEGTAARHQLDQVLHAGARGKELVDRILAFSRSGIAERVPIQPQSAIEETLELLAASLPAEVHLQTRLDALDVAVVGDVTQLHQVCMNLCTNALQAMKRGGVLTVALEKAVVSERRLISHGALGPGSYVRLCVSDTGTGIPPAVLERMFDPFFTTKRVGDGTGLGLALVHGIVADFGGVIDVTTQLEVGTTFTIWLPATNRLPTPAADPAGDLPRGNGETVMIVDDERALVALAEEILAGLSYEPVGFDSSLAALEAFRLEPKRFDLVLTDQTMPDLTGTELAREIRQLRPEIPILLMSGFSGSQLSERAHAVGVIDVLHKPLVRRDIAEPVARALQGLSADFS